MIKRILCGLLALAMVLPVAGVNLAIDSVSGQQGDRVTVPVRAMEFQKMISIQGSIAWDTAIVSYVAVDSFGLSGLNGNSFGTGDDWLTFSWNDNSLQGIDLPDSAVIFTIDFDILGGPGSQTALSLVDIPTTLEFADTSFSAIPYTVSNGTIAVPDTNVGTGMVETTGSSEIRCFPHPVSLSGTHLKYTGPPTFSNIHLSLLNLQGQVIRSWIVPSSQALSMWKWAGRDEKGNELPDGTYLLHWVSTNSRQTIKLTLNKRP